MDFSVHHKCLPPDELESALKSLPPEVQTLAALPMIEFLSWGHPKVPPELQGQAIRDTVFGQIGSLCITDQNRETISVILGRFQDLNLEMIHVAQITADREVQNGFFNTLCDEGKTLIAIIERMERLRGQPIALTERTWCKKYLDPDRIGAYPEDQRPDRILDSLGKYLNRRTSRVLQNMENANIGNTFGNDKIALFAYYLRESGFSDALNAAESECVAYGFEHRIEATTALFVSACQRPPGPEAMADQQVTTH